jgi:O-antigen chain-terminating methyltransferase
MIETTIPEINVVELMERVRAKAEEIRRLEARPKLPPIAGVKETPRAVLPTAVIPKTQKIVDAARDARQAVAVSRWIPKPLRGLFRRQDRFDRDVLRSIDSLAHTNGQLADRLRHLTACVEVQDHAIQHLADLRRRDADWMRAVAEIIVTANERVTDLRAAMQTDIDAKLEQHRTQGAATMQRVSEVGAELASLAAKLAAATGELGRATEHLRHLKDETTTVQTLATGVRADLDRTGEHLRSLQALTDSVNTLASGVRADLDRTGVHLRNLQDQVDRLAAEGIPVRGQTDLLTGEFRVIRDEFNRTGEHLRNLQAQVDRTIAEFEQPLELEQAVARLEQRLTDDGSYVKGELSQHRSLLGQLLVKNGAKVRARTLPAKVASPAAHDAFYLSFEDRFRGPRQEIKRRQEFYLPFIRASKAGTAGRVIVDVGCGRGEWLELLQAEQLEARGIDINTRMVAHCTERRLDAIEADALAYLRKQKPATLGAVTGFHIIEHLPFDALLELFAQSYRVLKPGGIAIFESPNCKNLIVGASNFNIDPTHRNPVYPETAEFMLSLHGFQKVQIHYLAPVEGSPFRDNSAGSKFLDDRFFGPQDFSVVGVKPAAR